jgi:hypothetical protein
MTARRTAALAAAAALVWIWPVLTMADGPISLNFQGLSQSSLPSTNTETPAISGAIGTSQFAEFVNGGFAVYSRVTGGQQAICSDQQFWSNAGISSQSAGWGARDPRILFDPSSGHWFATEVTTSAVNNQILLAVSIGADASPTAGNWKAVSVAGNSGPQSSYQFVDLPTLGLDSNAVYISTIDQSSATGSSDDDSTSIFSIPKSDLIAAAGPSTANMTSFFGTTGNADTLGQVLQPAINFSNAGSAAHLFATNNLSFGEINRTDITVASSNHAILGGTQVTNVEDTYFPISPRQPDGTGGSGNTGIDPLDDRLSNAVYQVGNLVYMIHAIGLPADAAEQTNSGLRWTILRISGSATEVVQEGTIEDLNFDYFQPTICADSNGDVVIGYDRSGPNAPEGGINSFFSIGRPDASGTVTFGSSQEASSSNVFAFHNDLDPDAWTPSSSLTPDPLQTGAFWLVNEVPSSSTTWGSQITEIVVPEPALMASAFFISIAVRPRRRRRPGS